MGSRKYEASFWNPDFGRWTDWKEVTYEQYCQWFAREDLDVRVKTS